jgi:hypothetical protein
VSPRWYDKSLGDVSAQLASLLQKAAGPSMISRTTAAFFLIFRPATSSVKAQAVSARS